MSGAAAGVPDHRPAGAGVYPIRSRLCRSRRRLARPEPGTKSVRGRIERRRQRDPPRPADVGVRDRLVAALSPPIQTQSSRLARTATEDAPRVCAPTGEVARLSRFPWRECAPLGTIARAEGRLPRAGVVLEGASSSTFRPRGSRERRWGKGGNVARRNPHAAREHSSPGRGSHVPDPGPAAMTARADWQVGWLRGSAPARLAPPPPPADQMS